LSSKRDLHQNPIGLTDGSFGFELPSSRTITVFRTAQDSSVFTDEQTLDGGNVLPSCQVDISDLFSRLNRSAEMK